MMTCKKCGEIVTGKYCSNCGKKVTTPIQDYNTVLRRKEKQYISQKWQKNHSMSEQHTASLCWFVSEKNFKKSDTYKQIVNGNYNGDYEHLVESIENQAEEIYQDIIPIIERWTSR